MELNIPTFATVKLPKYTEEIAEQNKPIDADAILTDDALERGGLVKVEAFMRTKTSAAAARKAQQRAREESIGLKQINIKTTEETGQALKSIANEIGKGLKLVEAIIKVVPSVTSHDLVTPGFKIEDIETFRLAEIGRKIESMTGWRRLVAKAIGIL